MTGLVLAGGGVKGSYQIGSYLAFKKCGIKIDGVVGTSIGSFNAALIASGKEKELYEFWKNVNVGELLDFSDKYTKSVNNKETFKKLIFGIEEFTNILKNRGIKQDNLIEILDDMIDEDLIRHSNMDFGLCTVRLNDLKPLYLFKEDMIKGRITEYILASCNLPVFKSKKLIDNKRYIDGGFYDNKPINMLINKGYNKIYSIEVHGIGLSRKVKDESKITRITPSRFVGSTLNVDKDKINDNIKLGYYDTLKVLKELDGYNFIFKKHNNMLYNRLIKKVDSNLYDKCKKYFKAKNNKELVLLAIEYILNKENLTYYNVYNVRKIIKYIKKNTNNNHFVYEFVKSLKMF